MYQRRIKKQIPYDLVKATVVSTDGKEDIKIYNCHRWNEEKKGKYIHSIGQLTVNNKGELYVDYKDYSIERI